jgi:hypothetical protein
MLTKSNKLITFQAKNNLLLKLFLLKYIKAITGAVTPAIMSQFLPSKVITSGISFERNNQYKQLSTGILTTLSQVNSLISNASMNALPFVVLNAIRRTTKDGANSRGIRGGIVLVVVKKPYRAGIA